MLKTVIVAENPFDIDSIECVEVEDLCAYLKERFPIWPEDAKIYHEHVAQSHDVTPVDDNTANRLEKLEGKFYVVVYPAAPPIIIAAVVVVLAIAATIFLRPKIPKLGSKAGSSNNELSGRSNKERLNGRIPDIFGTLRAVPDLLSVPYSIFDRHEEMEYSFLCVGRGSYDVWDIRDGETRFENLRGSSVEVFAPNTPLYGQVEVTFFGQTIKLPLPGNPEIRIGSPISMPLLFPKLCNSVNGQTLRGINDKGLTTNCFFASPNSIMVESEQVADFTSLFAPDEPITISGATFTTNSVATYTARFQANGTIIFATGTSMENLTVGATIVITGATFKGGLDTYNCNGTYTIVSAGGNTIRVNTTWNWIQNFYFRENGYATPYKSISLDASTAANINLDGTYTIIAVSPTEIVLDTPAKMNADWSKLTLYSTLRTPVKNGVTLQSNGPKWVGPFGIEFPNFSYLTFNFVATQGLYQIDSNGNQSKQDIGIKIEVQQVDVDEVPIGPAEIFGPFMVEGSKTLKSQRALTVNIVPSWATGTHSGRCMVRVHRETPAIFANHTVADEVKWRDLYALAQFPPDTSLGDVTVVRTATRATTGALSIKERKLNMLVTRRLPQRVSGSTFTEELFPTDRVDDIISAICLDPYIGGRQASEIDFDNIYDTIAAVKDYFHDQEVCVQFSHTFDDADTSFEEMIASIADAAFCIAYRRGSQIKLKFEEPTNDSTLLFNHRNKVPGTETRSVRFGVDKNYDGIEYEYVSPLDDSPMVFYISKINNVEVEQPGAKNPKRIETIGIRSRIQAFYHAWRIWNKMKYQNTTSEFEATQEADLLLIYDRILVADDTRSDTQDGEILNQDGLLLTLSRNVDLS